MKKGLVMNFNMTLLANTLWVRVEEYSKVLHNDPLLVPIFVCGVLAISLVLVLIFCSPGEKNQRHEDEVWRNRPRDGEAQWAYEYLQAHLGGRALNVYGCISK